MHLPAVKALQEMWRMHCSHQGQFLQWQTAVIQWICTQSECMPFTNYYTLTAHACLFSDYFVWIDSASGNQLGCSTPAMFSMNFWNSFCRFFLSDAIHLHKWWQFLFMPITTCAWLHISFPDRLEFWRQMDSAPILSLPSLSLFSSRGYLPPPVIYQCFFLWFRDVEHGTSCFVNVSSTRRWRRILIIPQMALEGKSCFSSVDECLVFVTHVTPDSSRVWMRTLQHDVLVTDPAGHKLLNDAVWFRHAPLRLWVFSLSTRAHTRMYILILASWLVCLLVLCM